MAEDFRNILPANTAFKKSEQCVGAGVATVKALNIDAVLKRVPPIEVVFEPGEEIKKLRLIPRGQRREAVSVFKDKLARQREAWALCRTSIEFKLDANPDFPKQEMVGIIGQFALGYGFAEPHVRIAEQLVDDYIEQHRRVAVVRKEYPDNIALINRLTGVNFGKEDADDFQVRVGQLAFEIFCSGINAERIYNIDWSLPSKFNYIGFAQKSKDSEPIYFIVVNNDYLNISPLNFENALPHENEHQKNRIFKPHLFRKGEVRADVGKILNRGVVGFLRHQIGEKVFGFERCFAEEVFDKYMSAVDSGEKEFFLGEYMRLKREIALNYAKDEIIAMKAEPNLKRSSYNIFSKEHPGHDYLEIIRGRGDSPLWQDTVKSVLVDGYKVIIDSAIDAFDQLTSAGYSKKEVIALLSDRRLPEWPKTSRRLIEARKCRI